MNGIRSARQSGAYGRQAADSRLLAIHAKVMGILRKEAQRLVAMEDKTSGYDLDQDIPVDTGWREDFQRLRQRFDGQVLILCLTAAVVLTLQHYIAQYPVLRQWLSPVVPAERLEMAGSLLWCAAIVLLYGLIPMTIVKLVFRQSLRDYGWSLTGLRRHWKPYALLYLIMVLPLLGAATTPAFRQMYPFFKYVGTGWHYFLIWQLAYALQFIAVEFFFRGFLAFGLYRRLGVYGIPLVMLPYCMIHFPKPMGEALGAIGAGLVLSYLALKNRSIWGGAALHWGVAFTMDAAVLLIRGLSGS